MRLRVGDWVEIRSKEEILRSLDPKGQLEELPLMPEMFRYCGQRFRVHKRAHKTCDTINGSGGRGLETAVHLELRCNGSAHGDCQAACLIFWKEAWLRPLAKARPSFVSEAQSGSSQNRDAVPRRCTEEDVWKATRYEAGAAHDEPRYSCQATRLLQFTTPLPWWDARQYVEDYTSGNATLGQLFRGFFYAGYFHLSQPRRPLIGRPLRWLYDRFQDLWGGIPFPRRPGTLSPGQLAPISDLNLEPGDGVRVKPYADILATVTGENRHRGLLFDAEMVPYCGGEFRVRSRVTNFIDEKTGKMTPLKTPAVILDHVWCQSRYSTCRMFCPRSIYSWWREVWLERVPENRANSTGGRAAVATSKPLLQAAGEAPIEGSTTIDLGARTKSLTPSP